MSGLGLRFYGLGKGSGFSADGRGFRVALIEFWLNKGGEGTDKVLPFLYLC